MIHNLLAKVAMFLGLQSSMFGLYQMSIVLDDQEITATMQTTALGYRIDATFAGFLRGPIGASTQQAARAIQAVEFANQAKSRLGCSFLLTASNIVVKVSDGGQVMVYASTRFRSESDLVEYAIPLLSQHFGVTGDISKEVTIGRSVADLLLVFPQHGRVATTGPLTVNEAVILSTLRSLGSATRIDLLEKRCGLERRGLRDGNLDRLVRNQLIRVGRGGSVSCSALSRWAKIFAFEAKLTKWRRALRQAQSYLLFADRSYVVLPSENSEIAAKNAPLFRSVGVGLVSVEDGFIQNCVRAKRSTDHNWQREYLVSRVLA